MASRIAHQSTVEKLSEVKNLHGTLDRLVVQYGFAVSKGTLARTLNGGPVSECAENEIRDKLGLPPIKTAPAPVCSSCLAAGRGLVVHAAGDCHDKPVADVVVLTETERIVKRAGKPRRNRPRYHRPCMTDEKYAEYLRWPQEKADLENTIAILSAALAVDVNDERIP